jgi:flagellar biosynthesis/type III secretory pathway M-ring protein FliF/YscJ
VLPVLVFVAVAIPLLLIAFAAVRRRSAGGDELTPEAAPVDAATQAEYEEEFEQADAYQEQWRAEHKEDADERFY